MSGPAFRPAVRKAAHLRVVILGATKGGKTTTALALALHLARLMGLGPDKVAVIDTEVSGEGDNALARSEQLVGEPCPCAECHGRGLMLEGHQILQLTEIQHTPAHYGNAIRQAVAAKFPILVVDGVTPEWEWCLAEVDRRTDIKNATARWAEITPPHDAFLRDLTTYPGHLIVTCRAKEKVSIGEDRKPVDMGWQPVQREGFLFEFDHEVWMHGAHARVKARSGSLNGRTWDKPGAEMAAALLAWSRAGEAAAAARAVDLQECLKLVVTLPEAEARAARAWLDKAGADPSAPGRLLQRLREKAKASGPPTPGDAPPSSTSPGPSAHSGSAAPSGAPPAIPSGGAAPSAATPAGGVPSAAGGGGEVPPASGSPAPPVEPAPSTSPGAPSTSSSDSPAPGGSPAALFHDPNSQPVAPTAPPGLTRPARRPRKAETRDH